MNLTELEYDCGTILRLKNQKKEIEETISAIEQKIKGQLVAEGKTDEAAGKFLVHIKTTPPTRIVDTAKLRADGLFEKYSKDKAGYDSLMVTENKKLSKGGAIVG